jgi:hypothetical protein
MNIVSNIDNDYCRRYSYYHVALQLLLLVVVEVTSNPFEDIFFDYNRTNNLHLGIK